MVEFFIDILVANLPFPFMVVACFFQFENKRTSGDNTLRIGRKIHFIKIIKVIVRFATLFHFPFLLNLCTVFFMNYLS